MLQGFQVREDVGIICDLHARQDAGVDAIGAVAPGNRGVNHAGVRQVILQRDAPAPQILVGVAVDIVVVAVVRIASFQPQPGNELDLLAQPGVQLAEQGVGVGVIVAGEVVLQISVAALQVFPVAQVVDAHHPVAAVGEQLSAVAGGQAGCDAVTVAFAVVSVEGRVFPVRGNAHVAPVLVIGVATVGAGPGSRQVQHQLVELAVPLQARGIGFLLVLARFV